MTDNNAKGNIWDMSELASVHQAQNAAAQIAAMTSAFYKRLVNDGLPTDTAADLCHTFLAAYFDTVQAKQANEAQEKA